jgi:hypothetical protein
MLAELIYAITVICDLKTKTSCALVSKEWNANIYWSSEELHRQLLHACVYHDYHLERNNLKLRKYTSTSNGCFCNLFQRNLKYRNNRNYLFADYHQDGV